MLSRLAPAILALVTACQGTVGSVQPAPVPASAEPVELVAPATDLSGGWATGTGAAPQVPKIVLHPSCTVVPAVWLIEQKGSTVRAWAFPERYNQGLASDNPMTRVAPAAGTISGTNVTLDDGTYRYLLTYDTVTTHLLGTRNGESFWAVRQQVARTETCIPPPT